MSKKDDDFNFFLFTQVPTSYHIAASVDDEPTIKLIDWDIKKDTAGNRYFVGTRADTGSGRASTAIVEFDPEQRRGRTESGRVYVLQGPGGLSRNGEYVWSLYKRFNGITEADK